MSGLIIDLFAGGGGASLGIERALKRHVDIAINHSETAIAAHARNHPRTKHYRENVWRVSPSQVCAGRPVDLLWASPACTHHSRAKNGTNPKSAKIRSLASVVIVWARQVRPKVIMLENVKEFADWGPLDANGKPIKAKKGKSLRCWWRKLERLGYVVEARNLVAANYGTPTTRDRFFLIARCDSQPIVWPEPTHAQTPSLFAKPWRSAAECIDWSIPCQSIFGRKKPLVVKTLRRIAAGINRFVLDSPRPFIVTLRGTSEGAIERSAYGVESPLRTISAQGTHHALVAASMVQSGYGERKGQAPRVLDLRKPLGTVVTGGKHALVAAYLAKHYGGPRPTAGQAITSPLGAITTVDHHALVGATLAAVDAKASIVDAFLAKYSSTPPATQRPIDMQRNSVMIDGALHRIVDIGMRMLKPRELFAAQGFPESYDVTGMSDTAQIALCGNSVCPQVAEAIVRANLRVRT